MIILWKYFHDSQNILLTLAPGCEFFSAKYVQFTYIYGIKLNQGDFSFGTAIIRFLDKVPIIKVIKIF